jgi:hypothetical protein
MPPTPRILKNQYVLVRHGRSEANEAGIISSDPDVGAEQHDLTDFGREQVHKTTRDLREKYTTDIPLQIYASPFLRTRSTAAILHDEGFPETPAVVVDDRLAERFFGMWDGKEDSNYENVCYLSIFAFFVLMMVTADNWLLLFFGWEGVGRGREYGDDEQYGLRVDRRSGIEGMELDRGVGGGWWRPAVYFRA